MPLTDFRLVILYDNCLSLLQTVFAWLACHMACVSQSTVANSQHYSKHQELCLCHVHTALDVVTTSALRP